MRILVAPQEFKGVLSARQVAEALAAGIRRARPDWPLDVTPIADGGPGTIDVVHAASGGVRRNAVVEDPLGRLVKADWLLLDDGTAVVEMAQASGLWRLNARERDARSASTFGTGQLIAEAARAKATSILVGAGGSATNDGGAGALQALGLELLDEDSAPLPRGGAALAHLTEIKRSDSARTPRTVPPAALSDRLPTIETPPITVITDVRSPLLGPTGATHVFAGQKGADARAIAELERALAHYADLLEHATGRRARETPGAGAAGGLAFGLAVGVGAAIQPGFDALAALARLDERIAWADVVLTGEGRLDAQTRFGKGPQRIAERARASGRRVVCFCGRADDDALSAFDEVIEVAPDAPPATREDALRLVTSAAEQWALGPPAPTTRR